MSGRFKPLRRLRSELWLLAVAMATPALLVFSFPLDALRPIPPEAKQDPVPSCSFVTLTPSEEHKVLMAARAAWQLDRGLGRRQNIDLFVDALPPLPPRAVLGRLDSVGADRLAAAPYLPDPLPATMAAPPPAVIDSQPDASSVVETFSKEELLKLN